MMAYANMSIHDLYLRAVNALDVVDEVNYEAEEGFPVEELMDDGLYAVDEFIRLKEQIGAEIAAAGLVWL